MSLRHDRRRLLVTEDASRTSEGTDRDDLGSTPTPLPREIRQRRSLDLVASRPGKVWGAIAALLLAVTGLGLAHVYVPLDVGGIAGHSTLDLAAAGNLSQWFATMLLGYAGLVALDIYSLRRLRVDDYYGRYRAWIWVALACLVASLTQSTEIAALTRDLCERLAPYTKLSDALVWHMLISLPAAIIGFRLFLEVRRSKLALTLLLFGATSILAAIATERVWLTWVDETQVALVTRLSFLVGYVTILAAFLVYARRVILELTGVIAPPAAQRSRKKKVRVKKAPSTTSRRAAQSEDDDEDNTESESESPEVAD